MEKIINEKKREKKMIGKISLISALLFILIFAQNTFAKIFREIHLVKSWGRGIKKILKLAPKTKFAEVGQKFVTLFPRELIINEELVEKVGEKVGETEIGILNLITEKNEITYKELAEKIGITQKSIFKNIEKLKTKGLLKRVGPDKGGHWEVKR